MKATVALRKKRNRDRHGRFIVEGHREIRCVLQAGVEVFEYYVCDDFLVSSTARSVARELTMHNTAVGRQTNEAVFRKLSFRQNPEGLLVVARQFDTSLANLRIETDGLYLILSGIEKPGNLGSMLRTADAVSATGVIVCDPVTDVFNPNTIRSSLGTFATNTVTVCTSEEALTFCRNHRVKIIATSPSAEMAYRDHDMRGPVAVVIGSEKDGLEDFWLQHADVRVRLPSLGMADSINAAMAATVMLFEARRQRDSQNQ